MANEADTCRKYVLPKLYHSGWTDDQINEQRILEVPPISGRSASIESAWSWPQQVVKPSEGIVRQCD